MRPPQVLNDSQKERIRRAFENGEPSKQIAVELQISRRLVFKYYQKFRGYPIFSNKRLTPSEKRRIREGFEAREPTTKVAGELGRSSKIVRTYYQRFRGYPERPHQEKKKFWLAKKRQVSVDSEKPQPKASRFYHSDFIPS